MHAWRLVMSSGSWSQLWLNRQHDGHPMTWFSALYAIKLAGAGVASIKWINYAFAVGSALLLLFYARLSLMQRILSVLSYWHLYEFTAFARNYAIGIFFCFLFCTLYQYRAWNWARAIMLIAWMLLMQTNLCMMLLGPALAAIWVSDLWQSSRRVAQMIGAFCVLFTLYSFADVFVPNIGFSYLKPAESRL
jgi:hypothetical protein